MVTLIVSRKNYTLPAAQGLGYSLAIGVDILIAWELLEQLILSVA